MADLETYYFDCQCHDATHTLRFTFDPDDGDIYTEVQLKRWHRWYQRLWMAVKYVFGYQSRYGYYDCTLLRVEDYDRLRDLMSKSEIATAAAHGRARQLLVEKGMLGK